MFNYYSSFFKLRPTNVKVILYVLAATMIVGALTIISTSFTKAASSKRVSTTFDQSAYRWFENRDNISTAFDTDGVIDGAVASSNLFTTATDSTYMYIAGDDASGNFRIEKRLLTTGELCTAAACGIAFNADGVIDGAAASEVINTIAIDSTYMYIAGDDASGNFRIEKRLLTTGELCTAAACGIAFNADGVIDGAAASNSAKAISIDGTYMYVAGNNDTSTLRIEKRLLTTGALDTNFDGDGVVDGVGASTAIRDIALDSTYMYVVGSDASLNFRIEKRLLTTGALDTNFDGDGVVDGVGSSTVANAISTDGTYMYVVGNNSSWDFRIEKRLLTTGALDTNFDGDGVVDGVSASQIAKDIAIDSTYMYVVGTNLSQWRIEKRLLTTGALDTNFDGDGVVDGVGSSTVANAISTDGTHMYVGGDDYNANWRIEKRTLNNGALAADPIIPQPLSALNTPATAPSQGSPFRLRMNLHIDEKDLTQSGQSFKLQFAGKGAGTCTSPSGTPSFYTDVTASTIIKYYDNPFSNDNAALSANPNDPTHTSHTLNRQTYEEANNFTNSISTIHVGQDGMWDFALVDSTAPSSTSYCFRAVKADNTLLNSYTQYPEIKTN